MKKMLLGFLCLLLAGCASQEVTVHIITEQNSASGLGGANIVQGRLVEKMGYGLCAGAKSGEVVAVTFKIVKSDSGPSGNVWFFNDATNTEKKAASKLK